MHPPHIPTRIFLDGGIPQETKKIIDLLGFLDGQTTNPTLITKHPSFIACQNKQEKCSETEAWEYYKEIVSEISPLVPNGSVSIEVYADRSTKASEMIAKGRELTTWIPNAHVKLPITPAGLEAAHTLTQEGIRVNMTLCFSQQQAAAVYSATKGAQKGQVFVSPFVGRLDDIGTNGMSLIHNIMQMFEHSDHHVEVLVASVRSADHLRASLALKADILTAPFTLLEEWRQTELSVPNQDFVYDAHGLKELPFENLNLDQDWHQFDIAHELTDKGLERFAHDWNQLLN